MTTAAKQLQDDIAAVIGARNFVRLCEALGGAKIYVPRLIGPTHAISHAIGAKEAMVFAEHFHGMWIDLPKAHLRRQRVLELARSGTMTIADAARACDYTERRVYQLLAAEKQDDGQLDLFG
ncbi:hypothetical protein [Sphingomonas sp. TX0522]|uniref:hypothetical protein n=1 Tax=Sphingomonas sp. TX0522 TaxID=2479205 RepID=UPI0018DF0595|nr:hypothetical protein [Sphingomonas sp. TX0522]MBI0530071.1 hypothetical protein [Sphingomonas sp. TX0522]